MEAYDIVDDRGVVFASFRNESDADRYERAIALIDSAHASSRRLKPNPAEKHSSFGDVRSIPHIDDILTKLNYAVFGTAEFKLTDRCIPLIKFFFQTNTQVVGDTFFKLFAMFTSSQHTALIKYFRNVQNSNIEFKKIKEHDRLQGLLMFWVASKCTSNLDSFLSVRVGEQVFFLNTSDGRVIGYFTQDEYNVREYGRHLSSRTDIILKDARYVVSDYFSSLCQCTQGLSISTDTINLATNTLIPNEFGLRRDKDLTSAVIAERIKGYIDLYNSEEYRDIENIVTSLNEVYGSFDVTNRRSDTYAICALDSVDGFANKLLSTQAVKNFNSFVFFANRVFKSAKISLVAFCRFDLTKSSVGKPEVIESFILGELSKIKEIPKELIALEDLFVLALTKDLMYLANMLNTSNDALEQLSAMKSPSLNTVVYTCIDRYKNTYHISGEDIHTVLQESSSSKQPLLNLLWPMVQDFIRADNRCYEYSSGTLSVRQYLLFLEDILDIASEALITNNKDLLWFCGISWLLDTHDLSSDISTHPILRKYPKLDAAAKQHFGLSFSDGWDEFGGFSRVRLQPDVKKFLLTFVFEPSLHKRFSTGDLDLSFRTVSSDDQAVSIYLLPKEHFLNLFVGHEKISNCCMYPLSVGFSCSEMSYLSSDVRPDKILCQEPSASHIVLAYDHNERSFIGSAWVYQVFTITGLGHDDQIVNLSYVTGYEGIFQIDQFELTNKYETNMRLQPAVTTFIELCVREYCSYRDDGFVIINKGSYTSEVVKQSIDDLSKSSAATLIDEALGQHVCFGPSSTDVYRDSSPETEGTYEKFVLFTSENNNLAAATQNAQKLYKHIESLNESSLFYCESCDQATGHVLTNSVCDQCALHCAFCGEAVGDEEVLFLDEHSPGCPDCVAYCSSCEENKTKDDFMDEACSICKDCMRSCECCGVDVPSDSSIELYGDYFCDNCVKSCSSCGQNFVAEQSGDTECEDCSIEDADSDD